MELTRTQIARAVAISSASIDLARALAEGRIASAMNGVYGMPSAHSQAITDARTVLDRLSGRDAEVIWSAYLLSDTIQKQLKKGVIA